MPVTCNSKDHLRSWSIFEGWIRDKKSYRYHRRSLEKYPRYVCPSNATNDTKSQDVNGENFIRFCPSIALCTRRTRLWGCETTSLDPYAYIWDYLGNCLLSVLRTEDVNMVKKGTNVTLLVDPNELLNSCSKSKTTLKNTLESRQIFMRPITIQCTWQKLAEASTWDLEGILARNGMVPLNSYSI